MRIHLHNSSVLKNIPFFCIIFLYCSFFYVQTAEAQTAQQTQSSELGKQTFSGCVWSTDSVPISNASITVVHIPDSVVMTATLSDIHGRFSFELDKFPAQVMVSRLGYLEEMKLVDSRNNGDLNFYLETESSELAEFTVKATRSNMKAKPGMFTFDPGDMVDYIGNAKDLMEFVPLITSFSKEDTRIFSKTERAKIYINGEDPLMSTEALMDKLKATPSSKIKRIELIMDPGARYGDENVNSGIINIIMDDDLIGWNASLYGQVSYFNRRFNAYNVNPSWFYQNHNLLFSVTPYYSHIDNKEDSQDATNDIITGMARDVRRQQTRKNHNLGAYITGEYRFGMNSIGASFGVYSLKNTDKSKYEEFETSKLGEERRSLSESSILTPWNCNLYAGIRYIRWLDKSQKSSLKTVGSFQSQRPIHTESILKEYNYDNSLDNPEETLLRNQSYDNHNDAGRVDIMFTKTFADGSEFSASGTFTAYNTHEKYTDTDNGYYFYMDDLWWSWSADYSRKWCSFLSSRIGVSQGSIHREIEERVSGQRYDDTYWVFTPKANLTFSLFGGNQNIDLSYRRNISDPNSNQLNPYRRWLSATEYIEGNPHLRPIHTNTVSLQYSLYSQFFLSLDYYFGKANQTLYKYLDEDGNTVNTYLPNERRRNLSADASWTKNFFNYRWQTRATVTLLWNNSMADTGTGRLDNHSVNWFFSFFNRVRILPAYGFNGTVAYNFSSASRYLTQGSSASHSLRFTLDKTLWRNAQISGNLTLPLNRSTFTYYSPGMEQTQYNKFARDIMFSIQFTWSFGKFSIERVSRV